ncbi:LacI family DNA-binding transcriptional regulator [Paenibacillus albidus]|uniref:LacI family DNA-binding transcriptional regulator n=1 Tax=Paenibacillus albidus TaxID=2041023 RepID=UPI001BE8790D|nr:LacI family DNA-binding transcriptional regulator [Paenibacillus albidus]MBT2287624.1 LacI family DNA-binding transcriptional regulator [Paenibacillus albidus]
MKMEDIAKLANVSKSAVSLAFSGKPGVGPDTRERILQVAHEAGYSPKSRAAAVTKADKSLLFLVCTNSGIVLEEYYQQPFFKELIQFIEERCRQKGYSLIFSSVDIECFQRGIQGVADEKRSTGTIVLGTNLTREQIRDIHAKLPNLIVLDTCFETLPVQFIQINNVMGAYEAGAYLCDNGHTSIGYIASNVRIHNFEERKRGFMAALTERGLKVPETRHFSVAPAILSSQDDLKRQLTAYLASGHILPTAWFCECDYMAISAMKTMNELGIRVPQDTSVIGFDNITESLIVTPELTTVHVDKEKMAILAVDLLTDTLEQGSQGTTKIIVDTIFVERNSCAANRGDLE